MTLLKIKILILLSCCAIACSLSKTNKIDIIKKNSLFSGFQTLSKPRENINIGAEWIEKFGPSTDNFLNTNLIESNSFLNYEVQSDNSFDADLKGEMLSYFGVGGKLNFKKNYTLILDSIAIIRVGDLKHLNLSTGKTYIWEGIKVKAITLIGSKEAIDTLNFNINNTNKKIEILASQSSSNIKKVKIKGLNLFCAFRLIRIGGLNVTNINLTVRTNKEMIDHLPVTSIKSFTDSREYTGTFYLKDDYVNKYSSITQFENEQNDKLIWPDVNHNSNYSWILEVECNNEIIQNRAKIIKYKVGFRDDGNKEDDYSFNLQTKIIGNLLVRDVISIQNLQNIKFKDINSKNSCSLIYSGSTIELKRYSISIENFYERNLKSW